MEVDQIREKLKQGKAKCFTKDAKGTLWFGNHLVVPFDHNLRELIVKEAHDSRFSIHPRSTKMYQDLKKKLWWSRMKQQITQFVAKCDVCQRVKAEHLKSVGTLQPLPIPKWKWEEVGMDFITGLPKIQTGSDAI